MNMSIQCKEFYLLGIILDWEIFLTIDIVSLQFYVYQKTGVRVLSKQDVVLYINEEKVSKCDTNGQCNTNSKDNVCLVLKHLIFEWLIFFPIYSFNLAPFAATCNSGVSPKWIAKRMGKGASI